MTTDPKLLPCPFCGGTDIFIDADEYGSGGQPVSPFHCGCSTCQAEQRGETEDAAIEAWNRRAQTPYVEERELLEATLPYLEAGHVHVKMMDHGVDISQPCERCELAKRIRSLCVISGGGS